MRLVRALQWLVGGGLGALIFMGAPVPDPQIAPLPHPRVAAFSHPRVAALSRPGGAAILDEPAASRFPADAVAALPQAALPQTDVDVGSRETPDECIADACVDQYLWSLYQCAPKVDTIKVPEQISVIAKKKGKILTVAKTVMKLVAEDFAWKDAKAAEQAGMSLQDYVIGGMDRDFRLKLYHALRALDDAGLAPGITSGFRDNYRQSIASGLKAASDSSYHGGSRRGGYGHGLAADLVSVKGETRSERLSSSQDLWKWIDAHGADFGIGRPYLDRDPPHVGPIDGREYADHRGVNVQHAGMEARQYPVLAAKQQAGLEAKKRAGLQAKQHAGLEAKKLNRAAAPEHHAVKRARTARA